MKISPRAAAATDITAFLRAGTPGARGTRGARVAAPASARAEAAIGIEDVTSRRPEDAPSVLRTQVATQARFGTFVQAAGAAASPVNVTPTADPGVKTSSVEDLLARLPEDVREEVKRFVSGEIGADYYTPENTADRIANFALTGFDRFEGGAAAQENTAEARRRFVDFILPAIDKGYGDALAVLGDLSDQVRSGLERTRTLIGERLETFAAQTPVEVDA